MSNPNNIVIMEATFRMDMISKNITQPPLLTTCYSSVLGGRMAV